MTLASETIGRPRSAADLAREHDLEEQTRARELACLFLCGHPGISVYYPENEGVDDRPWASSGGTFTLFDGKGHFLQVAGDKLGDAPWLASALLTERERRARAERDTTWRALAARYLSGDTDVKFLDWSCVEPPSWNLYTEATSVFLSAELLDPVSWLAWKALVPELAAEAKRRELLRGQQLLNRFVASDESVKVEFWGSAFSDGFWSLTDLRLDPWSQLTVCDGTSKASLLLEQLGRPDCPVGLAAVLLEHEVRKNTASPYASLQVLERAWLVELATYFGSIEMAAKAGLRIVGLSAAQCTTEQVSLAWRWIYALVASHLGDYDRSCERHDRADELRALLAMESVHPFGQEDREFFLQPKGRPRKRCRFCRAPAELRAPQVVDDWTPICRICLVGKRYVGQHVPFRRPADPGHASRVEGGRTRLPKGSVGKGPRA